MILAVVLLAAGTALPADATFDMPDDEPTAAVVTDSTGNELSFVGKDTENGFVLEYYFNGSLDRIYQIPADVSNGEKITAYSVESGKAYYLAASQGTEICAAEILPQAAGPYRDVGYISYNYSSALGSSTVCDVQLSTSRGGKYSSCDDSLLRERYCEWCNYAGMPRHICLRQRDKLYSNENYRGQPQHDA